MIESPCNLEEVRVEALAVVVGPLDSAAHGGRQPLHLDADALHVSAALVPGVFVTVVVNFWGRITPFYGFRNPSFCSDPKPHLLFGFRTGKTGQDRPSRNSLK